MVLRGACSIKKYSTWIVSALLGLLLAGGLTYAGNAIWHGTDWVQTNKIVTPREIADNLEYLNQKIASLEQSTASSTTVNNMHVIDLKHSSTQDYVFDFGKAGTAWNMIRLENFYQLDKYISFGNEITVNYQGSGYISHTNGDVNIYIQHYNDRSGYHRIRSFIVNSLGTTEQCITGTRLYGNNITSFDILCFWKDTQENLKVRIRGSVPYGWNTNYGYAKFFVFK